MRRQREEPLPSVCRDEISASREVEGKIDAVEAEEKASTDPQGLAFTLSLQVAKKTSV